MRPEDLDAFLLDLHAQGLRRSTRQGFAASIRELCRWLEGRGRVLANPARDLPLSDDERTTLPPAPLSEAEVARLIEAIPRRNAVDLRNRIHTMRVIKGFMIQGGDPLGTISLKNKILRAPRKLMISFDKEPYRQECV